MTTNRSFLPNDDAILVCTSDAKSTVTAARQADWRDELREYRKELDIKRLMMNRTGVCG